jgi:5-methylcytosine-specific restriction endonuclease McrA
VARVASSRNEKRWVNEARRRSRRDLTQRIREAQRRARARRAAVRRKAAGSSQGMLELEHKPRGRPTPGRPTRQPADEGPTSVSFRMDPLQLARFEALIESIRKQRILPADATRTELLLCALDVFATGSLQKSKDRSRRRRHNTSHYQIVLYRCAACARTAVRTSSGERLLSPSQAASVRCDARLLAPGGKTRSTITPALRREVMIRDGHRCRAPGCGRTRFLEVHHIIPREQGGSHSADNLVTLCSACHSLVHDIGGERLRLVLASAGKESPSGSNPAAPARDPP